MEKIEISFEIDCIGPSTPTLPDAKRGDSVKGPIKATEAQLHAGLCWWPCSFCDRKVLVSIGRTRERCKCGAVDPAAVHNDVLQAQPLHGYRSCEPDQVRIHRNNCNTEKYNWRRFTANHYHVRISFADNLILTTRSYAQFTMQILCVSRLSGDSYWYVLPGTSEG